MRSFLILGGLKRHVKDFKMMFLDEYVLYVFYGKNYRYNLRLRFLSNMLFCVLFKARKKICMTKYELSNMDEYVMHDVRNYQYPPTMIFVMNVILYVLKRKMGYCDLCSGCLMDIISC